MSFNETSIVEMLEHCRFYVEGVVLLPVSIIGILGMYLLWSFCSVLLNNVIIFFMKILVTNGK